MNKEKIIILIKAVVAQVTQTKVHLTLWVRAGSKVNGLYLEFLTPLNGCLGSMSRGIYSGPVRKRTMIDWVWLIKLPVKWQSETHTSHLASWVLEGA